MNSLLACLLVYLLQRTLFVINPNFFLGDSGTGKSTFCRQASPHAFWKQPGPWWDTFGGGEDVILDDFDGWIDYCSLMRFIDKNPMDVQTKGGHVPFNPRHIYITSNLTIPQWYPRLSTKRLESLCRRVDYYAEYSADRDDKSLIHFKGYHFNPDHANSRMCSPLENNRQASPEYGQFRLQMA